MKLLYIAAPYRAKTIVALQQNIHEAKLMAQYYWTKGYAVICPHLNSANFDGLMPDNTFLAGTMEMLSRCDFIAMHPKWADSEGCVQEHLFMLNKQKFLHFENLENNTEFEMLILYPTWDEITSVLKEPK